MSLSSNGPAELFVGRSVELECFALITGLMESDNSVIVQSSDPRVLAVEKVAPALYRALAISPGRASITACRAGHDRDGEKITACIHQCVQPFVIVDPARVPNPSSSILIQIR
jgi:hypothetical protein